MVLKIFLIFVAILLFLFLFWKKLKEDYGEEIIFASAFLILFGTSVGFILSVYFFLNWLFWITFLGSALAVFAAIKKYKLRTMEVFEAWVLAGLTSMVLAMLYSWIVSGTYYFGFGFIFILVLICFFIIVDKYYKSFSWYKSGKVGFTGLTTLGLFFLVYAGVAAVFPNMLSFLDTKDAIISAIMAFVSFLAVFNLAQTKT